jgi:hypothetical protein
MTASSFRVICCWWLAIGLASGCDPDDGDEHDDLPAGWEDATKITNFFYDDCSSGYDLDGFIEVEGGEDFVRVDVFEMGFLCLQHLQGFQRIEGSTVDILIQPDEEETGSFAKCNCGYDLVIGIEGAPAGDNVEINVFSREGAEPILFDSATASVMD